MDTQLNCLIIDVSCKKFVFGAFHDHTEIESSDFSSEQGHLT